MTIQEKVVYVTDGKQFSSLEQAQAHRHDLVGEFFDATYEGPILAPGERIAIAKWLADNRNTLVKLLIW